MRISDWSSDVCSSDLDAALHAEQPDNLLPGPLRPHDRAGIAPLTMLAELLPQQAFALLLVFVRLGSALMLMPGFGESYISPRIRLLLALAMTVVVHPVLPNVLPALPDSPFALFLLIFDHHFRSAERRDGKECVST